MTDFRDSLAADEAPFDPSVLDGFDIANLFNEPMNDIDEVQLRGDPLPQGPNDLHSLVNHADPVVDANGSTHPIKHPDFQVKPLGFDVSLPNALLTVDDSRDVCFPPFPPEVQDWAIATFDASTLPITSMDNSMMKHDLHSKPVELSRDFNALQAGHRFHDGTLPFFPR
jgi:hypothetical protein